MGPSVFVDPNHASENPSLSAVQSPTDSPVLASDVIFEKIVRAAGLAFSSQPGYANLLAWMLSSDQFSDDRFDKFRLLSTRIVFDAKWSY